MPVRSALSHVNLGNTCLPHTAASAWLLQKRWHLLDIACKAVDKVIAEAETPRLQHAPLGSRMVVLWKMMQSTLTLPGMLTAVSKCASCCQSKVLHACIPAADAGVCWPLVYICSGNRTAGCGNRTAGCCQKQQHKAARCARQGLHVGAVSGAK